MPPAKDSHQSTTAHSTNTAEMSPCAIRSSAGDRDMVAMKVKRSAAAPHKDSASASMSATLTMMAAAGARS